MNIAGQSRNLRLFYAPRSEPASSALTKNSYIQSRAMAPMILELLSTQWFGSVLIVQSSSDPWALDAQSYK